MTVLTAKQAQALAVLRDHRTSGDGDGWLGLDAVAAALGTNRRGAGSVLGALERLGLALRWEPLGPSYPRFTAFANDTKEQA